MTWVSLVFFVTGTVWYCLVFAGPVWYCLVLDGPVWYFLVYAGVNLVCWVLDGPVWLEHSQSQADADGKYADRNFYFLGLL